MQWCYCNASKYTQVRKGWVVNCIFCLKVIELFLSFFCYLCAGVCVFVFKAPSSFVL